MKEITVIGIGLGNPETLTLKAHWALEQAGCIIGARRMLESLSDYPGEKIEEQRPCEMANLAKESAHQKVSIVFSGDVGFYSGAKKLYHFLDRGEFTVIPGVSSVQYFAALLGRPWQDFHLVSGHGRACDPVAEVQNHKETFFLTDQKLTPKRICQLLEEAGLGALKVTVGENLSTQEQVVRTATATQLGQEEFASLSVVLVDHPELLRPTFVTQGIGDDQFLRGQVPMTKREVRSVALSMLQIGSRDILYDIGAGTGSVGVEMALQAAYGKVYGVEKNQEAQELIRQNREKFGCYNLVVVEGEAPEALEQLPPPDGVFVGGSTGRMAEILATVLAKNPQVRIVTTAITLETLGEATTVFEQLGLSQVEILQLAATRYHKVGRYRMPQPQSPIFILSGVGSGE